MSLRKRLQQIDILVAPGVYDGLTAALATDAGFEALYLSGAAVAYTRLGRPDIGLTTASEMAETMALIADRTAAPVIIDADTGFGKALNAQRIKAEKANRELLRKDIVNAVYEGALMRVRPIMMTVITVIVGLLPIMLGDGTGSEIMRRIAAPMVGGMVSATILTLIVIPALFLIWRSRSLHVEASP